MSQETTNPMNSWADVTRQWQDMMMSNWSSMSKEVVGSDAFGAASSACLDYSLAMQKQLRSQSGQFMESLEFPKRSDMARLAKQVASVESKVLELEDKLDDVLTQLKRIAGSLAHQSKPAKSSPAKN